MEFDKNLWHLIENGDEAAYENVYIFYYQRFYIYGLKFTGNIALIEDTIQEIMISIWEKRETFSGIQHPAAYFYTSFRNLLLNKLKVLQKILPEDHKPEDISPSAENYIIHRETSDALSRKFQKAFTHLTARQYEAVFLRFYEELPYEEVAAVMGISIKATYKIMARALSELKHHYLPILYYLAPALAIFSLI